MGRLACAAQAAKRALYERRSAQALGDSLDDLAVFAEQSVGIADADDPLFGPAKKQRAPKGVLGRYLNAAKQVAEETAKMDRARADSLVLSREIQERPLRRSEGPAKYGCTLSSQSRAATASRLQQGQRPARG